jgi:aerobic carbon-monoxide dehydrogenase large subunit
MSAVPVDRAAGGPWGSRFIGTRMPRLEDRRLLGGGGRYTDDLVVPGARHAVFVRSPHAHAAIAGIDTAAALAVAGCIACLTAADLRRVVTSLRMPLSFPAGLLPDAQMWNLLAEDEVCYVGEAVAIVVAESRALAEDAAALVEVDYRPLPAAVDPREALREQAAPARTGAASNLVKRIPVTYGDVTGAFAQASRTVTLDLTQHRGIGSPMETRGVVAAPPGPDEVFTVWSSTQKAHALWADLCAVLAMEEDSIRVIVPDVGGGFGTKFAVYPEELAIPAAAKLLGMPIKWIEDRAEHFVSAIQERDQYLHLEAAVDARGRLLALRGELIHDQGAYSPHNVAVPYNSGTTIPGPYVVPAFEMNILIVQTNKPPVIPVRGAGYPQACFAIERMMDRIGDELAIDRAEVRRRNYIQPEQMPYLQPLKNRAGVPVMYDSGDYPAAQHSALAAVGYDAFAERQAQALAQGRYIGIGIAAAVKGTGRGPYESGLVRVAPSGRVMVYTGAHEMGQGIRTTLAQVCAETLGVRIEDVHIHTVDTHRLGLGHGGYSSRQAITAGSAVMLAAREVRAKALAVAGGQLGVDPLELTLDAGRVIRRSGETTPLTLGALATTLRGIAGYAFPAETRAGLESTQHFHTESLVYANAFHCCEVEVDIRTGAVHLLRYVALQDSGRLLNPLLVEGQIHGSVVHGIGNALFEYMRYDEQGQPQSGTFADYLLPTAPEIPQIEVLLTETPCPDNPLGAKGVGETGMLPVTAAVIGAIEHALAPLRVRLNESPLSPVRILELIEQAGR